MSFDDARAWYGGSYSSEPEAPQPPNYKLWNQTPSDGRWLDSPAAEAVGFTPRHSGPALVMGRFNPLHSGHAYLLQTASKSAAHVITAVWWKPTDVISSNARANAVFSALPQNRENRVFTEEDLGLSAEPGNWAPWVKWFRGPEAQKRYGACTVLVSSDEHARGFAEAVGLAFLLVDPKRTKFPISATTIRRAPWTHWEHIAPYLRPNFARTVALVGPEGAGKTTLGYALSKHYAVPLAEEYLRTWSDNAKRLPTHAEFVSPIAKSQSDVQYQLRQTAPRFGFADTEGLTLDLWSQRLFKEPLSKLTRPALADAYLLVDATPWPGESARDEPNARQLFVAALRRRLEEEGKPYTFISGPREGRLAQCVAAVDAWVASNPARLE